MTRIDEELSARFSHWEQRGRGWQVYPTPVSPEPLFVPFPGYYLQGAPLVDDGRRPTAISSLLNRLWTPPANAQEPPDEDEPQPVSLERKAVVELPLVLPMSFEPKQDEFAGFISSLALSAEPLAFELIGSPSRVMAQLAVGAVDEAHVRRQLNAFFPEISCAAAPVSELDDAWQSSAGPSIAVDFALGAECVLPLATLRHDLAVPLVAVLGDLRANEMAVYQVLFQAARHPWAENLLRAVTGPDEKPFFVNAPELAQAAKAKIAEPLFGVVARVMACAPEFERVVEILRGIAGAFRAFRNPVGNELIPLHNREYPAELHIDDVLLRQTHRGGMLLNQDELIGFIGFPTNAVRSAKLVRQTRKTKQAPALALSSTGLALGINEHAGISNVVRLGAEQRIRHTHIVGASGTGKSTLLFNLIKQDITNHAGVGILDPHGDLIERILGIIPQDRVQDVVLVDPTDEEYVVGFNLLDAHSDWEKNLLASDLVAVFRRLSTAWGDQMGSVLQNAILAFLESEQGGTLLEMRRFLLEPKFRAQFLKSVRDPEVVYYWEKGFTQLSGNKSIGPVLTRLEAFLAPKPIRYMVAQKESKLDFGNIIDSGKIFLAKLSQGLLGKENSHLLGSLLVAKFHQLAMSRQRQAEASRRDFWLYVDEFPDFMTPSMAEILTGARKYRIGLTLAHQELRQLHRDPDVASAVLANPCTRVCFRVGDQDARALEHGLSTFNAKDLQNLGTGEAIARVERSDYDFNLRVLLPVDPDDALAKLRRAEVIAASRERYATSRAKVEDKLREPLGEVFECMWPKELAARPAAKVPVNVVPAVPVPAPGQIPPVTPAIAAPQPVAPPPQLVALPPTSAVADRPPLASTFNPAVTQPVNQPPVVPKATVATTPAKKQVEPEAGKGGAQHKAIQLRLKAAAEKLGFRVYLEKPILGGAGMVDLVLVRGPQQIAVQVSVTNTLDYEFKNITKCVREGFSQIAMVGAVETKLEKIRQAVQTTLPPEDAGKVAFHLPEPFIAFLQELPTPPLPEPTTKKVKGWTVKTSYRQLSVEEHQARENAQIKLLAEMMRRDQV